MNFSKEDKDILSKLIDDLSKSNINGLSSMDELWELTDSSSKDLVQKIIDIDPIKYGFKGQYLGFEPITKDMVKIENDRDKESGEYELNRDIYIPRNINKAYEKMCQDFNEKNPKRKLLIGSAYRSPAFQIVILIYLLVKVYNFNISKTLKRVSLPQYSQHCSASMTALDILNIDGQPSDEYPEKFRDSVEYEWLIKNASKYNFYESYPKGNPDGIMPEPWHWQYRN